MRKLRFFAALCCTALLFAACEKDEPNTNTNNNDPKNDTKEAVDLGLSVKWATCNVGATSPEKYGNYYAWGETATKDSYSWNTYKYGSNPTKYNSTDTLTTLEAADDAATANWGGKWCTPTDGEWQELIEKCTWTWTRLNGVKGYEVKATNGNTIFLPAAGYRGIDCLNNAGYYGYYWSSSLDADGPSYARSARFRSGNVRRVYDHRYYGQSVRPVLK